MQGRASDRVPYRATFRFARSSGRRRAGLCLTVLALCFAGLAPVAAQETHGAEGVTPTRSDQARPEASDGLVGYDSEHNRASLDERGLTLSSADKTIQLRVGGRVELDFGTARVRSFRFTQPYNDDFEPRRTFAEGYLTLYDAYEFAFQYDFSDPTRPINDAVFAYRGFGPFIFSFGNMKEPFSLNQLMSDTNLLFAERSLADTFAPGRNVGFAIGANNEHWTLTGGVFGGNANTGIDQGSIAGTARLTYTPIHEHNEVLHFAIAGSFRSLDPAQGGFSYSVRPESYLFSTSLVNTGTIRDADQVSRLGLEAAYQTGPLRIQAEYMFSEVGRRAGLPGAGFNGGYIEAGYTINGNGRTYAISPKYGTSYATFGAPEIPNNVRVSQGGIGVFELAARVSHVDLSDRAIRGGTEVNYGFGVNWYPDKNIKVMADYIRAHADYSPTVSRDVDSDIFVGRFQLYW